MGKDHRIVVSGIPQDYTCRNRAYETDIAMGQPHGSYGSAKGSVTGQPLVATGTGTLWLEHVAEVSNPSAKCYWLMWYFADGKPAIPLSGVFDKVELGQLAQQLMKFVP